MSNLRILEERFHQYGSKWKSANSSENLGIEELRAIFNYCVSIQRRSFGPKGMVHFDFIENDSFNALAATHRYYDLVAIFSGALRHLYRLYYCFMSDPLVLPEIGNPTKEKLSDAVLSEIRSRKIRVSKFQHPIDDLRYRTACNLALISSLLILNHEIGHIAHCHIYLLQRLFNIKVYEELPLVMPEGELLEYMRAFEWEADEYSAVCTYQFIQGFKSLLPSTEYLSIDLLFSIAIKFLFLLISKQSEGGKSKSSEQTHPAPIDRWLWMLTSLQNNADSKRFSPSHEELLKGIREATAFWSRNSLSEIAAVDYSKERAEVFQENFSNVNKLMLSINQKLKQFELKRNEYGRNWIKKNKEEVEFFRNSALDVISSGPVMPIPLIERRASI